MVSAWLAWAPLRLPRLRPLQMPPLPFEEALRRGHGERHRARLNPACRNIVLTHGQRARRVFVLLHGLTNCPAQFAELGRQLHAQGHAVLIPRMPFHGWKDQMTPALSRLTPGCLAGWAERVLDIAHGLGEEVVVAGLSVNGVTAAWIAQERGDVARGVVMAPLMAPKGLAHGLAAPLGRALCRLPNFFVWWDPQARERRAGPPHAYPRFSTRALGGFLVLAGEVMEAARRRAPACKEVAIVTTAADAAVSLRAAQELAQRWRAQGTEVGELCFPADENIPHDFIDPAQPNAKIASVYPRLLRLLTCESWPPPA